MALRISFKPGMKQSQQAARYFHDTVGNLVETMIDGLQERSYLIPAERGPSLGLRTWCADPLAEDELHELFEWMLAIRADIQSLRDEPGGPDQLSELVKNWLASRMGGADLFVELSIIHPDTGTVELPEFSLGLMRGRSVMISTDTLLFTWLEQDIFGLTMAGHGSYLLELEEEDQAMRKAS
jgi:hypothetical protein